MKVLQYPPRGGKTEAMLKWAAGRSDAVIVTFSTQEAARLREIIVRRKLTILPDQIISVDMVRRGLLRGRHSVLGVDNADMVLADLLGRSVEIATVTG